MGDAALMPPAVSVVVPVRNRSELLSALLEALGAQSFRDFEVVVVDDGSTDPGVGIALERWDEKLPLRVVRQEGAGAVAARRAGVAVASAPIIAFTDSDCRPDAGWLAAGVAVVRAGPPLVQGRTVPDGPIGPLDRCTMADREDGLYPTCNLFVTREAYEAAGGFDVDAGTRLRFRWGSRARDLGFGEDTLLGWAVRRRAGSSFCRAAVVRHHVFPPDARELISRAWVAGAFPALVNEVPELRDTLLHRRLFLGTTRLPLYAAAAVLPVHRRTAGALLAVWLHRWWRHDRFAGLPLRRRLRLLPLRAALDGLSGVALLLGTARARTPVL